MKKTFFFLSMAAAMTLASCGGQAGGNGGAADSLSEAELTDSLVLLNDSTGVADNEDASEAEVADGATINMALVGDYSNNNDPSIDMVLSDKMKDHDGRKGYGYVTPANDYFEYEYALVFKTITPDGDNIKVHYDKMSIDYGEIGEDDAYNEEKIGEGDLTIVALGGNKVKLDCNEPLLKNKVLYKR